MQYFADQDAKQLEQDIQTAIDLYKPQKIIILTHVPPFPEVCLYQSRPTDVDYLPYFSSKAMGDVLLESAQKYTYVEFFVLSGHTHSYAHNQILKNLSISVGDAKYYQPTIQKIIDLKNNGLTHKTGAILPLT